MATQASLCVSSFTNIATSTGFFKNSSKSAEFGKTVQQASTKRQKISKRNVHFPCISNGLQESYGQEQMCTDTDVTFIQDEYSNGAALSWLDTNYLTLKIQSYKIVESEAKHALQNHFKTRRSATPFKSQVCARSPSHTFVCGDTKSVSSTVCPASVVVSGTFIGTCHMA